MDLSVLITTPALIFTRTLAASSDYAQLSYLNFEPAKIFVRTPLISNIQYTELSHVSFSDANIFNRTGLGSVTRHYAELSYLNFETANLFSRYMVVFDPNDDVGVLLSENLDFTPPVAPNLLSPVNGATSVVKTATLSWDASVGADTYNLQVATDVGFTSLVIDESLISDTYYNTTELSYETKYYWRASATNVAGTSDWSEVWNFTTWSKLKPKWVKGYPEIGGIYDKEFDVYLKMDSSVTCYYVILPKNAPPPTPEQIIEGKNAYGIRLNVKERGSTLLTAFTEKKINIKYLKIETTYNIYFASIFT